VSPPLASERIFCHNRHQESAKLQHSERREGYFLSHPGNKSHFSFDPVRKIRLFFLVKPQVRFRTKFGYAWRVNAASGWGRITSFGMRQM
jgi:hypothetical protein